MAKLEAALSCLRTARIYLNGAIEKIEAVMQKTDDIIERRKLDAVLAGVRTINNDAERAVVLLEYRKEIMEKKP